MKFSCLSENLAQGLSIVSKAISAKGSLPILSHVLLKTDEGRLQLGATDLETGIVTWVGAKVEEDGGVTVPARLLSELVSHLPPGKIELTADDKKILTLSAPQAHSRLNGMDAGEFPPLPSAAGKRVLNLSPQDFLRAVSLTSFASARDESRPILTGILVKGSGRELRLVGVDGFRLAEKKLPLAKDLEEDVSMVIPAPTLLEVARLGSRQGEGEEGIAVTILGKENQVLFDLGSVRITSRLLEGPFPDYEKIIPRSFSSQVKLSTEEFLKAVRLASVFAKDSAGIVKLKLKPGELLTISANTSEVGDNVSRVEATIEGEPLEIAFNSKYLIDVLSNLDCDEVVFEAGGPLNPGIIKPADSEDYLYVVMPVRTAS